MTCIQCEQTLDKKLPKFPQKAALFLNENIGFKNIQNSRQIFGLLLLENMLQRTFKIPPIWSHCMHYLNSSIGN